VVAGKNWSCRPLLSPTGMLRASARRLECASAFAPTDTIAGKDDWPFRGKNMFLDSTTVPSSGLARTGGPKPLALRFVHF